MSAPPRRFRLQRDTDATGVSGTGEVATGLAWPDGRVALRWMTEHRSTAIYESMSDVERIHGHGGATRLGGSIDDSEPDTWCSGCGCRHSIVMLPRWVAIDIRKRADRSRPPPTPRRKVTS